ncbi:hypothetical protein PLICRDRAFT_180290 [Plicaturopsis crispa FD-325 SS-3]|uniref:DNA 3'-5' helicase n=1 Tax=Plicaturopsis crispa FD-325 SS-3 TaxID=944288 RepID=A0A0C9T5W6_PLICR|nr:hypothetical protein PLICRDRAFT_180290 [Plicaturopsis crispa FD-325 SS-3]
MDTENAPERFKFSTPEGWALCRRILREYLPYEPHDYQLDGITKALDGIDVLAITATGSGKSGYIYMLMLVIQAINGDPSLCPTASFPKNAAAVVVCPTTSLEEDLEGKLRSAGLTALAISRDTVDAAEKAGEKSLWLRAEADTTVILVTPEMLTSKGFERLLRQKDFEKRVFALIVDEAHLMNSWGVGFRPPFLEIGNMRARFPSRAVMLALTATLRAGQAIQSVCELLGLHEGRFHLIRRSNMRHDVQILFRTLRSSIMGTEFPELDWVLREKGKILIFCRTIRLGFQVALYLWHRDPSVDVETRRKRIRLYNSLNWPKFNTKTLELLHDVRDSHITIATDTLSVGIDIADFQTVIVLDPEDTDEYIQKVGRVGRDRTLIEGARGIIYTTANSMEVARRVVEEKEGLPPESREPGKSTGSGKVVTGTMDISLAKMLVADCKIAEQDRLYDNPEQDVPCSCTTCANNPPPPRPEHCNCSGCIPEDNAVSNLDAERGQRQRRVTVNPVKKGKRLTRVMRAHGLARLLKLRRQIWSKADEKKTGFLPPIVYLPDNLIQDILDRFALLLTLQDIEFIAKNNPLLADRYTLIYDVVLELRHDFDRIRLETAERNREKKAAKRAAAAMLEVAESGSREVESEDSSNGGDSDDGLAEDVVMEDAGLAGDSITSRTPSRRSSSCEL